MREYLIIVAEWININFLLFPQILIASFAVAGVSIFIDGIVQNITKSKEEFGVVANVGITLFMIGFGISCLWVVAIFLLTFAGILLWLGDAIRVVNSLM